jgi:hypothetical protein
MDSPARNAGTANTGLMSEIDLFVQVVEAMYRYGLEQ